LTAPANTDLLGGYVVKLLGGILDLTDDLRLQAFIKDGFHAVIDKVDLSKSTGAILDTLTKDGRHQELLDEGIAKFVVLLRVSSISSKANTRQWKNFCPPTGLEKAVRR
jgi:uncharacterized membrane-anchored protein YjiN (DUF445 family)